MTDNQNRVEAVKKCSLIANDTPNDITAVPCTRITSQKSDGVSNNVTTMPCHLLQQNNAVRSVPCRSLQNYEYETEDNDIEKTCVDGSTSTTSSSWTPTRMSCCRRLCYSVGHILNDVTASMWFTYLLIYLHAILKFDSVLAGYLMLLGQVVDGIATPLVGYESDRTTGFCKLGRRKSWYLVGTICVAFSFPFMFNPSIDGLQHPSMTLFLYYAPFVIVFQFGWASTQISHLSLIPDLTVIPEERVELNSLRYGFTVLSNITVFGVAWLLLSLNHLDTTDGVSPVEYNTLQPSDTGRFRILVFTVMGIGALFVAIFFFGTKEKARHELLLASEVGYSTNRRISVPKLDMKWTCWLKEPHFYQVSFLYMCSRLYTNISQIYLPMYLIYTVNLTKTSIATIPLTVYASGFVASILMKRVNIVLGAKVTYFIGVLVATCASVYVYYLRAQSTYIYFVACLIGFGGSTLLVTALSLTSDLIACNTETGAFVYGAMSFTDKLSNGIAIAIIQNMHPQMVALLCKDCASFYKHVMTFVPSGALIVAFFVLLSLGKSQIGVRRAQRKLLTQQSVTCTEGTEGEQRNLLSTESSEYS